MLSWRQQLHQSVNLGGVSALASVIKRPQLLQPHIRATNLSCVDWNAIRRAGITGCVVDKDNTVTTPHEHTVHNCAQNGMRALLDAFESNVVLVSNSAGQRTFDPTGKEADALERSLGSRILRHASRKPASNAAEIKRELKCELDHVVVVGDRLVTDILYGNRMGTFTVHVLPLEPRRDNLAVRGSRFFEESVARLLKSSPPNHFAIEEPSLKRLHDQ